MGPEVGGLICGGIIGIAIGTLIGALILRGGVWMYNKIAGGPGSPSAVPEPSIGHAMGIMLVTTIVNMIASFIVGMVVGFGAVAASGGQAPEGSGATIIAQLISIPISLLVMSAMLTMMLPTTFPRALGVSLCYLAIALIVLIAIVAVVVIIALAVGGLGALSG